MAKLGTLTKIYQVSGIYTPTTKDVRAYYSSLVNDLDTNLIHVTSSCHMHSAHFEWMRERKLYTHNLLLTKKWIVPVDYSRNVYYALYTAYPSDFWFSTKMLAVEFKLRF